MAPTDNLRWQLRLAIGWVLVGVAAAAEYQGFGAWTPGGGGQPVVHVTNLNDSGPGSLREAVSAGNRTVVFDVAGEIQLADFIRVRGSYITIDGSSAPLPGITLRGKGLIIRGSDGAHDVIVRGLRVRDSSIDGIQIAYGAYNVVIDHCSVHNSADGNLDITFDSHDVTVSWCILAGSGSVRHSTKNSLNRYSVWRLSFHHNIYTESLDRNPLIDGSNPEAGTEPPEGTTADMRNNIVANWLGGQATKLIKGRINLVNNFYCNAGEWKDAIIIDQARAYIAGNEASAPAIDLNTGKGTENEPFPAAHVATDEACRAASLVIQEAGVRPLDSIDRELLSRIALPARCAPPAGQLRPAISAVVNAWSGRPLIADSAWTSIFGSNLAPRSRAWRADEIAGGRLPTALDGVSVKFGGQPGFLTYVSSRQINAQAPAGLSPGSVTVEVTTPGGISEPVTVGKETLSPALLTWAGAVADGEKRLVAVLPDGLYVGRENLLEVYGVATRPASPGEVVMIFGTGFGPTDPPVPAGQIAGSTARMVHPVSVRTGGLPAEVVGNTGYFILAGVYQLNVRIPENAPAGELPVEVEVAGVRTQQNVSISVRAR